MDKLFQEMKTTKQKFYDNMFQDFIHILKDKKNYDRQDAFDKIKLKYTFYDFDSDNYRIFDNLLHFIKIKIIKSLNDYKINSFECRNTIEDYRNYYKRNFKEISENLILDFNMCREIDNYVVGYFGKFFCSAYGNPINENEYIIMNNNRVQAVNIGIFTFDIYDE